MSSSNPTASTLATGSDWPIDAQLPLKLRRRHLTKAAVLTIYPAIAVLALSIIVIAIAVGEDSEVIARLALSLVLAATVIAILGLAVAAMSLAQSADAITYAVEPTGSLGGLVPFLAAPLNDDTCRPGGHLERLRRSRPGPASRWSAVPR